MAFINGKQIPFVFQNIPVSQVGQYAEGIYTPPAAGTYNTGTISVGFQPDAVLFMINDAEEQNEGDLAVVMRFNTAYGVWSLADGTVNEQYAPNQRWQRLANVGTGFRVVMPASNPFSYPATYKWYAIKMQQIEAEEISEQAVKGVAEE